MTVPTTRINEQIARSEANKAAKKPKQMKFASNPSGVIPPALLPYHNGEKPRPLRARSRLNGKFMTALADDFEQHGRRAIERMRIHDPSGYIKTVAFLMPKQFEQTTPMQDLTDDELERGIEYLRSKLIGSDGKGVRPAPLLIEADELPAIPQTKGIS